MHERQAGLVPATSRVRRGDAAALDRPGAMARQITTASSRRTLRTPAPRRGFACLSLPAAAMALSLLASVPAAAQQETGEVRGTVVDVRREAPVGLAAVSIPELGRRTVADGEGRFRFRDVPPGSYELRVRFLGYEAAVREVEVPAGGTRTVEVRVAPVPVELEELKVTARLLTWVPGFRERRENRRGHFFTRREIEKADPDHLTELLRDREGVRIGFNANAHGPEKRYPQFYYRGPGPGLHCRPAVFVDGDMMGPGEPWFYFNEIPADEVLAMEVYYRESDLPDAIDFDHRGQLSDEDAGELAEFAGPDGARDLRSRTGTVSGVQDVLAAAGVDDVLNDPVPQQDEDLQLPESVLEGLYDRRPRVEHCGAIFVWTRLYPLAGD